MQPIAGLLNDINFGLLPSSAGKGALDMLSVTQSSEQTLELKLHHCWAKNQEGYSIHYDENETQQQAPTIQLKTSLQALKEVSLSWYVLLDTSHPSIPASPELSPFVQSATIKSASGVLTLSLLSQETLSREGVERSQLPLGRILISGDHALLDERYIPPCTTINSHPALLELHSELVQFYGELEYSALQIVQRIRDKQQPNELSMLVEKFCGNITLFTALHLHAFRSLVALQGPPLELVNNVCSFAKLFETTLNMVSRSEKEDFLNFCAEWFEFRRAEVEGILTVISMHHYNHLDINESCERMISFVRIVSHLFRTFSKLEFIGKRKERGIFIVEEKQKEEQPARGGFWGGEKKSAAPPPSFPPSAPPFFPEPTQAAMPVSLGASAPASARPGQEFTARFIAYVKELESVMVEKLKKLSPAAEIYTDLKECQWQVGTTIKVRLSGNYLQVTPAEDTFVWNGKSCLLDFDVVVLETAPEQTTTLKFDVLLDEITVARLRIELSIVAKAEPGERKEVIVAPIKTAFASYASEDRARVLDRVAEIARNGVNVFLDCMSIKAGEQWKGVLETEIRTRESFLLFWSSHARQSPWVRWEWQTALKQRGIGGIEPHPLEDPSLAPPPEELSQLHFGDVYMLVRTATVKQLDQNKHEEKQNKNKRRFFLD
jgi:hypothetical protein